MRGFLEYLTEQEVAMRGSLQGADSYKTISHLLAYVAPFLNKEQLHKAIINMGDNITKPERIFSSHNQEPDSEYSHVLAKKHGDLAPGTPIKAVGAHIDNGRVMVQTAHHGDIPMSRLAKPQHLKRSRVTQKAFDIENKLAENLGGAGAGSSKESHDFAYPPLVEGEKVKKSPSAKGVLKTTDEDEEEQWQPIVRGESKADKGVMGNAKLFWTPKENNPEEGSWNISHSDPEIAEHMKKAHVNGEPILQYLNREHRNGKILKGFSAKAPTGMTKKYFDSIKSNVVHVHDMKNDIGTTFTVGNELKGKTALSHLTPEDLANMDGTIAVGKTTNGRSLAFHRPNSFRMREYAAAHTNDPENHRNLLDASHAEEFKKHIDTHIRETKNDQKNLIPSGEHGGTSFYGPGEGKI